MTFRARTLMTVAALVSGLTAAVAETRSAAMPAEPALVQPRQPDGNCEVVISLRAGGAGVEYYFGYALPENDLTCEDFRSRDKSWDYCRIALNFFRDEKIPFAEMKSSDALIGNMQDDNSKFCFAKPGAIYLVYLPDGGGTEIDLSATPGKFSVKWFNPRAGGVPTVNGAALLNGGEKGTLTAPSADDWIAVIAREPTANK